jgi:hypothetical protein
MKHRFQVNSFEVIALVIPMAIANDELGAHSSTGGSRYCNHARRGCVNASTEWRRETLVKEKRARNRLARNQNQHGDTRCLTIGIGANASGAYAPIYARLGVLSEQHVHEPATQQKSYAAPESGLIVVNERYINTAEPVFLIFFVLRTFFCMKNRLRQSCESRRAFSGKLSVIFCFRPANENAGAD